MMVRFQVAPPIGSEHEDETLQIFTRKRWLNRGSPGLNIGAAPVIMTNDYQRVPISSEVDGAHDECIGVLLTGEIFGEGGKRLAPPHLRASLASKSE